MRRFRSPISFTIAETSLRDLYNRLRTYLASREGSNLISATNELLGSFKTFFLKLGKPRFENKIIQPDDPLDPHAFDEMVADIVADLNMGYTEAEALRNNSIAIYNYTAVQSGELKRRADEIASLVTDLRLLSNQYGEEVLVFSDSFHDLNKIDQSFPLDTPPAEVLPGQNALTLAHTGVITLGANDVVVDVTPISQVGREPNQDNEGRFYEGHFYTFLGEAEPEGGTFHIEERVDRASLADFTQESMSLAGLPENERGSKRARKKFLRDFVVPGGVEAQFIERLQEGFYVQKLDSLGPNKFTKWVERARKKLHSKDRRRRNEAVYFAEHPEEAAAEGYSLNNEIPITADNLILMDVGATDEELQQIRLNMLDGNPASYWQCELVRTTAIIKDFIERYAAEGEALEVPASELRELARSSAVDKEDFEVELLFTLNTTVTLNWITISPITFDDGAWLEVTELSTAPSLDGQFVPVESFSNGEFANVLTNDANTELPGEVATALLAPNKASYRGAGVWPFAARPVKVVRVRIKQKTPVPAPFERFIIQATRTLTTIHTRV